ncbi:WXG100 family type VII secretion target [Crossiella sp. CA198]|uniref:WXG100 family type VII secretion target n=1 Tax=Crossiella sp. CA198 TaxID=3455607 RepID=UPI003F8D5705
MSTPGYWEGTVAPNLPAGLGSAVKLADKVNKLDFTKDAVTVGIEVSAVAADATSLVSSCVGTAVSAAADPLGWLINQGLGFLINICTPLKQAIQLVSGNSEALAKSAQGFADLGKEIVGLGKELSATLKEDLKDWQGTAADAARTRMAGFLAGVAGAADKAGDIGGLLQIFSMVIKVVEEFIRGLLADLIEWLIITWLAALATAPITLGGSTAVASGVTAYKVASTTVKTTQKVTRLSKLINKIKALLAKLQGWLKNSRIGQEFMNTASGKGGKGLEKIQDSALAKATDKVNKKLPESAQRELTREEFRKTLEQSSTSTLGAVRAGLGQKVGESLKEQTKKIVGMDRVKTGFDSEGKPTDMVDPSKIAGKAAGYAKDGKKALDHSSQGTDQDEDKTRRDLDL